jgi:hypothetical protein
MNTNPEYLNTFVPANKEDAINTIEGAIKAKYAPDLLDYGYSPDLPYASKYNAEAIRLVRKVTREINAKRIAVREQLNLFQKLPYDSAVMRDSVYYSASLTEWFIAENGKLGLKFTGGMPVENFLGGLESLLRNYNNVMLGTVTRFYETHHSTQEGE